ncbi:hypothetical protein [Pedobacter cryoconitis]|uniref:Uncharacterized protein n=1 Tax=Pedobacter cryoconitis TaxID=188932 RepID=A0A7X0MKQ1_9SPHI|nr:hypothetical protein [Pedobacter cryoconitis]MBB6500945.1 hypothetical protein [Pedobacter cryoconitis]
MFNKENCTVEIRKYAIISGHVILFDIGLDHSTMFDQGEIITSAGLVCIWRKGNGQQVICCDEGVHFSVLSKPVTDEKLIAEYLGVAVNSINPLSDIRNSIC